MKEIMRLKAADGRFALVNFTKMQKVEHHRQGSRITLDGGKSVIVEPTVDQISLMIQKALQPPRPPAQPQPLEKANAQPVMPPEQFLQEQAKVEGD